MQWHRATLTARHRLGGQSELLEELTGIEEAADRFVIEKERVLLDVTLVKREDDATLVIIG